MNLHLSLSLSRVTLRSNVLQWCNQTWSNQMKERDRKLSIHRNEREFQFQGVNYLIHIRPLFSIHLLQRHVEQEVSKVSEEKPAHFIMDRQEFLGPQTLTLILTNESFKSFATSSLSNDSTSITWHLKKSWLVLNHTFQNGKEES